jgi:hypothetical protein
MAAIFTPEDGTGIEDANAFITVAFFKQYHADRGVLIASGGGDIEKAIVRATDFMIARWVFVGHRNSSLQGLHWPASDAQYYDGRFAIGVPIEVQQSCADYAKIELDSPGSLTITPTYDTSGANVTMKREKVGPIEEETAFGGNGIKVTFKKFPIPDRRLMRTGLVINGNSLLRI